MSVRRFIRGLLVGPLVAPAGYWIGTVAYAFASGLHGGWPEAIREIVPIAQFGLPVAYAATIVWGVPAYFALRRVGWLRAWTLALAGGLGGTMLGVAFAWQQRNVFFTVQMPILGAATLGALVGATCWLAGWGGQRRS